ncbi:MAG: hypothetical protein PHQ28_17350, partial [Mycobacterium sp.]|nr:hypothetical protein [Mycobacterium sp.]
VSGQKQPSTAAVPTRASTAAWQRWWLPAAGLVLVLLTLLVSVEARRRRRRRGAARYAAPGAERREPVYDTAAGGHWDHDNGDYDDGDRNDGDRDNGDRDDGDHDDGGPATEHLAYRDANAARRQPLSDTAPGMQVSWGRGAGAAAGLAEKGARLVPYDEQASDSEDHEAHFEGLGDEEENPDTVDTDSIPVVAGAALSEDDRCDDPVEGAPHPVGTADIREDAEDGGVQSEHPDAAVPRTAPDVAFPDVAVDPDGSRADVAGAEARVGRHAATDAAKTGDEEPAAPATGAGPRVGRPTIHLPMDDPYQVPDGYPIKASASFGLYYTPDNALYQDTLAEVWLCSEDVARANGFIKAD